MTDDEIKAEATRRIEAQVAEAGSWKCFTEAADNVNRELAQFCLIKKFVERDRERYFALLAKPEPDK